MTTRATTTRATTTPAMQCRNVSIAYGESLVVEQVNLEVGPAESVVLLGPSGSGKTTLLSAIAGFLAPDSGEIWIGGRLVAGGPRPEPPESRRVGVVFQHFALWPHLSALENVAYPFRRAGMPELEAQRRAGALLERLGLGQLAARRPAELSGGEQQRVGLARALARDPAIYLFDEPTAHLDTALRAALQQELAEQRRRAGAAALYATHDVAEAFTVADRIVVLRDGRIVQEGLPQAIYEEPVDRWTALLTGPAAIIEAACRPGAGNTLEVVVAGATTTVRVDSAATIPSGLVSLLVRPDWAVLGGPLRAHVESVRYQGSFTDYRLAIDGGTVDVHVPGGPRLRPGEATTWRLERVHLLPAGQE